MRQDFISYRIVSYRIVSYRTIDPGRRVKICLCFIYRDLLSPSPSPSFLFSSLLPLFFSLLFSLSSLLFSSPPFSSLLFSSLLFSSLLFSSLLFSSLFSSLLFSPPPFSSLLSSLLFSFSSLFRSPSPLLSSPLLSLPTLPDHLLWPRALTRTLSFSRPSLLAGRRRYAPKSRP